MVVAASFGALNAWAISQLDPAQQEIISLAYAPLGAGLTSVESEPSTIIGQRCFTCTVQRDAPAANVCIRLNDKRHDGMLVASTVSSWVRSFGGRTAQALRCELH